jgi:hypothetical protein
MRKQIPIGYEHLNCHRCLPEQVPMSEVCHKCPLWMELGGPDPITGEKNTEWGCVDRWLITGMFEMAKMINGTKEATVSFRNEMVAINMASMNAAASQPTYQPHSRIQEQRAAVLIESQSGNIAKD